MGFFDSLSNAFGSTGFWSAMGPAALMTIASMFKPEQELPYGSTQAGFEANLAAEQAMLNQKLAAEQAIAAMSRGGGGDTGRSAGIAAAASKTNTLVNANTDMFDNRAKLAADRLALKIAAKKGYPEVLQRAGENIIQTLMQQGVQGQAGFANAADIMSRFKA
jgi:hypothetical protein